MRIIFTREAWQDYLYWQQQDKTVLKRINGLIKESQRTPFTGTSKPEPLKGALSGFWSRRIDLEHRLVYKVAGDTIYIMQCRYHY